jgi:ribosomal protein S18 acetylase RimI-like enzyme
MERHLPGRGSSDRLNGYDHPIVTAPGVDLRRATVADAPAMAVAHVDSIRSLGPAYYDAEAVDAWAAAVRPQMYLDAMAAGEVFFIAIGAVEGQSAVLGFASHRPDADEDSVSVYVRGAAARQGLGSALLQMAERHARDHGVAVVTIEASLAGVAFYRRHGFYEVERGAARLTNGALIPCVVMRKGLAA